MARKRRSKQRGKEGLTSTPAPRRSRWGVIAFVVAMIAAAYGLFVIEVNRERTPSNLESLRGMAAGFNVVLITLDTTRADRIGCYGYREADTPNLDRLANEGLRFADAASCVPITLPAHCSIMTGLDPPRHGVRSNGQFGLAESCATLATVLRERSYETAAFVSAFVLDRRYGLARGFDIYDDEVAPPPDAAGGMTNERSANAVTETALRWLRGRTSERPCFLWVHYFDPHTPYSPPPRIAVQFPDAPYDGEVAFMDEQIGRLVDEVEQKLGRERTIIVAVGDHGESLGEHGEDTHSLSIYGATQRVPLLLWAPGVVSEPGVMDGDVVGIVDVFPTVLDLLGVEAGFACDGISLLRDTGAQERTVYMETMATYFEHGWAPLYALRRQADKYIHAPIPEYYNLKKDPQEVRNLLRGGMAEAARGLAAELEQTLASWPSVQEIAATVAEVDPETLRRLQALGYMGGEGPADTNALPDPKEMMALWTQLGRVKELRKAGEFDAALQAAMDLFDRAPDDPSVLREIGTLNLQLTRLEDAERYLRKSVTLRPDPDVWQLLGQLASRGGRFDEAEALLDEALALDPQHGAALIAKGDLRAMQEDYPAALGLYEQAKREDPHRAAKIAEQRIAQTRAQMRQP